MIDREMLRGTFSSSGIDISEETAEKLDIYAEMLVDWNSRINLTAITQPSEICVKHFLDSALPFKIWGGMSAGDSILDVGTGAGFPSCVVKLVFGTGELTLLDSLNKRINFLEHLSERLGLGAKCIHGRAEEYGAKAEFREKYDIVTARAVAKLSELCEYCLPFVKVGGKFVALKGRSGGEELKLAESAISLLGGKLSLSEGYELPGGDSRTLLVIEKVSPTPAKFPRNKGQMKRKPL